jgi:hypothetical protein
MSIENICDYEGQVIAFGETDFVVGYIKGTKVYDPETREEIGYLKKSTDTIAYKHTFLHLITVPLGYVKREVDDSAIDDFV